MLPKTIIVLALIYFLSTGYGTEAILEMPSGTINVQTNTQKDGWRQEGIIPLSYVMAREKMRESMRRQGWKLIMDIPLAGRGHNLSMWRHRGHRVIVRLWRIDAGKTGIAWGEEHHES